ncbi:hypothetical protein HK105_206970 [Polyrhizophydium stewartii]|uniref:Elongator complex protein 6 n=1 Tax=Polyrhizophydium stewartii TaxID=2732419 RepID=A0ABR4N1Y5_9FUNG|nr:hypothetical protein HK105_007724 [Polyrhizophydium stewartii]
MSLETLLNWPAPDRPLPPHRAVDDSSVRGVFVVTDTLERSGSFVLHKLVGRHVRLPGWAVALVCVAQQPEHYVAVHKKLGMHLSLHKQTFASVDLFSRLGQLVQSDGATDPVQTLFSEITAPFAAAAPQDAAEPPRKPCIVIDDVSMLLFVGLSVSQTVLLVTALRSFVIALGTQRDGCLAVLVHDDCPADEEQASANAWIQQLATVLLHVRPLDSGFTEGVHGQLAVALGPQALWADSARHDAGIVPGELLFRVNDASVDWVARGRSGL